MAEFVTDDTTDDEIYQACEGFIGNLNTLRKWGALCGDMEMQNSVNS